MPTHDEHGCHNHCIVECSEEEQLCLGQAGHDHHEGHEHDRDFHDHGDCAEPDFCIHKDRKNFFFKNHKGKIQNMYVCYRLGSFNLLKIAAHEQGDEEG